eukprot:13821910-Alexandrium_andersonii.AAC.2
MSASLVGSEMCIRDRPKPFGAALGLAELATGKKKPCAEGVFGLQKETPASPRPMGPGGCRAFPRRLESGGTPRLRLQRAGRRGGAKEGRPSQTQPREEGRRRGAAPPSLPRAWRRTPPRP